MSCWCEETDPGPGALADKWIILALSVRFSTIPTLWLVQSIWAGTVGLGLPPSSFPGFCLLGICHSERSKHVIALAESLRNVKLQKSHLELDLELLEHAAELVVKEEEEEGEEDSSSEDESEEESENPEEESEDPEEEREDAVTQSKGSAEKKQTEVKPLEPEVSCEVQKEDTVTEDSPLLVQLRHGDGEPREPGRMIEELGERLGEGLRIEEDVPRATRRISSRNTEGESGGERDHHQCAARTEREGRKTATSKELLDPCVQKKPLCIVNTDGLDSDDEDLAEETEGH